jgi:hypothetical protein
MEGRSYFCSKQACENVGFVRWWVMLEMGRLGCQLGLWFSLFFSIVMHTHQCGTYWMVKREARIQTAGLPELSRRGGGV